MNSTSQEQTLVAELAKAASDSKDKEFLRYENSSYTFGQIHSAVEERGSRLASLGIAPGDRVGIRLPNGPDWVIALLAIHRIEAIAVPINYAYAVSDLNHVLTDSGAKAVVTDSNDVLEKTDYFQSGNLVLINDFDQDQDIPLNAEIPAASDIRASAIANLQYTSGTTGFPKACMLPQSYWYDLGSIAGENANASSSDVALTAQPFSYIDPQWNVAMCLIYRFPLVIAPRFSASQFWHWVRTEKVTLFYVLGTMPTLLYKQQPSELDRENDVRLVMCSGIPPKLHSTLEERWGAPWREAYGLTETGIDIRVPVENTETVGSGVIGWTVPSKTAKVLGEDGSEVGRGEVGELVITGRPMMRGYWNRPEANEEALKDGWFYTGDLVSQREDGAFQLVGRLKDMVRRGGENISSAEVENVANEHPQVLSSAVVAVQDDLWGEEVKLIVQPRTRIQDSRQFAEELYVFIKDNLAKFKVPSYISFVDEFPLTPSERIAKAKIPNADKREGPDVFVMK